MNISHGWVKLYRCLLDDAVLYDADAAPIHIYMK